MPLSSADAPARVAPRTALLFVPPAIPRPAGAPGRFAADRAFSAISRCKAGTTDAAALGGRCRRLFHTGAAAVTRANSGRRRHFPEPQRSFPDRLRSFPAPARKLPVYPCRELGQETGTISSLLRADQAQNRQISRKQGILIETGSLQTACSARILPTPPTAGPIG